MGGMEFNKVFAAILVAGIVAMLSGFIAKQMTHPHELKEDAYPIEGVADAGGGEAKEKVAEPILAMLAEADIARGQKVSKACAACHSFDERGANGVGPKLWNVVGRKKQSVDGFVYSGVLNANGEEYWNYDSLNKFLWNPKKYASGTKMSYIGLKKPEDRAAIIAWLRTLSNNPQPLPSAVEVAKEQAAHLPKEVQDKVDEAVDKIDKASEKVKEAVEDASEAADKAAKKANSH